MFYRHEARFFNAFRRALESRPHHPHLTAWTRQTARLVNAVYAAADAAGVDAAQRRALTLRLDKRDISVETILATVRHRATVEYPYLLTHAIDHNLTALYASNLNERYWLMQLEAFDPLTDPALRAAIRDLRAHLDQIPSSQS